jgi:hypothetical protein
MKQSNNSFTCARRLLLAPQICTGRICNAQYNNLGPFLKSCVRKIQTNFAGRRDSELDPAHSEQPLSIKTRGIRACSAMTLKATVISSQDDTTAK